MTWAWAACGVTIHMETVQLYYHTAETGIIFEFSIFWLVTYQCILLFEEVSCILYDLLLKFYFHSQVWFQNRRSRWRKSLKNKPTNDLRNDVSISTMFQPSLASFQLPMHPTPFSPREPFFPPFTTSPSFIPFYENMAPVASQGSQTVSVMIGPRVSASVIPPFSCSASPPCSYKEQFQTSCLKDRHLTDDYLAAVTLASRFQREN